MEPVAAQRTYGGVSAEQRQAQRRTALLDAALDILAEDGQAKLTVAGLCARAGLNERYYYENFERRESVLEALLDRIAEELAAAIMAALAGAPPDSRAQAHAAIEAGVAVLLDDPRKARAALIAGMATPELRARTARTVRAFARLVAAEGTGFYGGDVPQNLVDFRAIYLVGGLTQTLTTWLAGDLDLTRAALIDQITDVFVLLGDDLAGRYR
ncbi:TetR/AcrR family transcriptional regulator [Nocardia rosealba]|uniref:TetR/AcrR family transcriptional regulator n=1 Tax=Nocardia rosealba TaxID=2878563 RepID=UPI001CD9A397|nr:TetR/AcrR family transcriptional regulator [Nocardia rosealba]MCA2210369.1 TetR/AcrR family transcriptional regulator [Nocardia rosealba]